MVQIKIYGIKEKLNPIKEKLSDIIHSCVTEVFKIPKDKKFHRFFPLKREDFFFPINRSESYTIIEILMFEGRKVDTKKRLVKLLFKRIENLLSIYQNDVEILILESPKYNWGIRGLSGNELELNYKTNL